MFEIPNDEESNEKVGKEMHKLITNCNKITKGTVYCIQYVQCVGQNF
jgi:hypothetical protein